MDIREFDRHTKLEQRIDELSEKVLRLHSKIKSIEKALDTIIAHCEL